MGALVSNTTIVLAPGTYQLTRTLYFNRALTNVGIRGATSNSDDVVLIGPGMTESNYGSVPFGIWTGNGVDGITIANLMIRDFYFHPIIFNAGTQNPHVYNVHLVDAGEQFLKSNPDERGAGANNGIVEYSIFEFTSTARDGYPKAIDVHGGADWKIRHNLFRNLQAPAGLLIGPAVLVWRGSSNTITEGNTFLNCGRGIMYGAEDAAGFAHVGGIIRNNFFYRSSSQPGDVGIQVADSPNTQVLHNTVLVSGTYRASIEYRFPGASGVVIANNLVDAAVWPRDGATASEIGNFAGATDSMFVNAPAGDLHLNASATVAIDRGVPVPNAGQDWDGEARPRGVGPDIGADESDGSTGGSTGKTSPDGTTVPGATEIVDNVGAVWTLGAGGAILRNGLQAAYGWGSTILWTSSTIYVRASDNNWWQWTEAGWVNVGPHQPGGATSGGTISPDGTTVPGATQIVDNGGAVWTLGAGGAILRDGLQAAYGWGSTILWTSNTIYVRGADNNWWQWAGAGWVNVGQAF